jgi:hypothetical protein
VTLPRLRLAASLVFLILGIVSGVMFVILSFAGAQGDAAWYGVCAGGNLGLAGELVKRTVPR